jgi:Putative amidoligase enzyme
MPAKSSPLSARLRSRYFPALTVTAPIVAWILKYDWTITDAERRQLLRYFYHDVYPGTPGVNAAIRTWQKLGGNLQAEVHYASVAATVKHRPCSDCGCMTVRCPNCDHCPNPECDSHNEDRESLPCGHCDSCATPCEDCAACNQCGTCSCVRCGNCGETCSHSVCSACNDGGDDDCGCCNCEHCSHCGATVEQTCSECDNCPRHCTCETVHSISATNATFPVAGIADRTRFSSQRTAGLEVEFNTCTGKFEPIVKWCAKWGASVHSDGSCGWEAVTSPAAGNHLLDQIDTLASALTKSGATENDACGVHVHVDAKDLKWHDMAKLVRIYEAVEPALYVLAGRRRWANTYCKPWNGAFTDALQGTTDVKGAILRVLYNSADETIAKKVLETEWRAGREPRKKASWRYHGLNLAPWIARLRKLARNRRSNKYHKAAPDSTVEFRLHEHCHDGARLEMWTRLLVRMVDFAASCSEADIAALPRSGMRALATIAPECMPWIVASVRAYRKAVPRKAGRFFAYNPAMGWYGLDAKIGTRGYVIAQPASTEPSEGIVSPSVDYIGMAVCATKAPLSKHLKGSRFSASYGVHETTTTLRHMAERAIDYNYAAYDPTRDAFKYGGAMYYLTRDAAEAANPGHRGVRIDYRDIPERERWIVVDSKAAIDPKAPDKPKRASSEPLYDYTRRNRWGNVVDSGPMQWANSAVAYLERAGYKGRYYARPLILQLPEPLREVTCKLPPGYVKPREPGRLYPGDKVKLVWPSHRRTGKIGTVVSQSWNEHDHNYATTSVNWEDGSTVDRQWHAYNEDRFCMWELIEAAPVASKPKAKGRTTRQPGTIEVGDLLENIYGGYDGQARVVSANADTDYLVVEWETVSAERTRFETRWSYRRACANSDTWRMVRYNDGTTPETSTCAA